MCARRCTKERVLKFWVIITIIIIIIIVIIGIIIIIINIIIITTSPSDRLIRGLVDKFRTKAELEAARVVEDI